MQHSYNCPVKQCDQSFASPLERSYHALVDHGALILNFAKDCPYAELAPTHLESISRLWQSRCDATLTIQENGQTKEEPFYEPECELENEEDHFGEAVIDEEKCIIPISASEKIVSVQLTDDRESHGLRRSSRNSKKCYPLPCEKVKTRQTSKANLKNTSKKRGRRKLENSSAAPEIGDKNSKVSERSEEKKESPNLPVVNFVEVLDIKSDPEEQEDPPVTDTLEIENDFAVQDHFMATDAFEIDPLGEEPIVPPGSTIDELEKTVIVNLISKKNFRKRAVSHAHKSEVTSNVKCKKRRSSQYKPPIRCDLADCPKTFDTPHLQRSHMKNVHMKVRIICETCGMELPKGRLSKHRLKCMKEHLGKKFMCDEKLCSATFVTRDEMEDHVKKVHDIHIKCPVPDCDILVATVYLSKHFDSMHKGIQLVTSSEMMN